MKPTPSKQTHASMLPTRIEPLEARIAPAFVSGLVRLADLSGADGSAFLGEVGGTSAGSAIASAGDVNGDGFDDFIIGLPNSNGGAGGARVIFGQGGSFAAEVTLAANLALAGFEIVGEAAGDRAGSAVAGAGDVNGDGFDDLIVGAPSAASSDGVVYVIFGKSTPFSSPLALAELTANTGIRFQRNITDAGLGYSVAGAGDVDGDGFDDFIVGAPGAGAGAAVIVYGKKAGPVTDLRITQLTGLADGDQTGRAVSGAGDFNGDGLDDVIIGAQGAGGGLGAAFVVFGKKFGLTSGGLGSLSDAEKILLAGTPGSLTGSAVSSAGDVNGDGFDDVIVGAPYNDGQKGAAYVVFGTTAGFSSPFFLETLDGTQGFALDGPIAGEKAGRAVSGAGDLNGDGFADLLIGTPFRPYGASVPGGVYVLFGHAGSFAVLPDLNGFDGTEGFRIVGAADGEVAGNAVSSAGDVNGDGFGDLLVGAPGAQANGIFSGKAYLIYGAPNGLFIDPTTIVKNTATFTDVDGDLVTVKVSGTTATLTAGNFRLLAKSPGAPNAQLLELTLDAAFDGADVSITAKRAGGGDGRVNVGFLNAAAADLGKVTIAGDLAHFLVGDSTPDLGLKSLTLGSMGLFGGLTRDGGGTPEASVVEGGLGALKIAGDFREGNILATATAGSENATIGSIAIGGAVGNERFSSSIQAVSIGKAAIAGDVRNARLGKENTPDSRLASLTIGGSVFASQLVSGNLPSVKIGGDFADESFIAATVLGNVTIAGSLLGGSGASGVTIAGNSVGKVKIGGDVIGGSIFSNRGGIAAVTIGGDAYVRAGAALQGIVAFGRLGAVTIKGDVVGTVETRYVIAAVNELPGGGPNSIASVKIGGRFERGLIGSSAIDAVATIGSVAVGGDWIASSIGSGMSEGFSRPGAGSDTLTPAGPAGGVSSIGSVTIKGRAWGSFEAGDRYGIVAEQIGKLSIGGASVPLRPGPGNDLAAIPVGLTPDFVVRELSRVAVALPDPGFTFAAAGPRTAQPAEVALGNLTGADGFKLSGVAAGDFAGVFAKNAGDVNGDGFDDVIVGAPAADQARGAAYVIFGSSGSFDANLALNNLDGRTGFKISGIDPGDQLGAVSAAGDFNGDGFGDLIVGASGVDDSGNDGRGAAYIIFGKAEFVEAPTPGFTIPLATLDLADGIKLLGTVNGENAGLDVSGVGDVNGDNLDDVVVGAPGGAGNGGAAYLILGRRDLVDTLALGALDGSNGIKFSGPAGQVGSFVSGAGDVNGDLLDDMIFGGLTGNAAFVVFGQSVLTQVPALGVTLALADLDGLTGFKLTGVAAGDRAGIAASGAGDVNGDGLADMIVGADSADEGGPLATSDRGAAYVIFGKEEFATVSTPGFSIALGSVNGSTGFKLSGIADGDKLGQAGAAGDVNGDGFADVIVGAYGANSRTGAAYVVFGHPGNFAPALVLSALDGANGFKITGVAADDLAGSSVNGAGDLNGDGFADVIVGSLLGDGAVADSGAAHVVFGGPSGEFIDPTISTDGRTATWTDVDGDLVTLKLSGVSEKLTAGNFKLLAKNPVDATRAQLLELTLGAAFDGAGVSITAKRAGGGDGQVNVGFINALGPNPTPVADLGAVTIAGDLGRLIAGDGTPDLALKSLTVGSLGAFGGSTQDTGGSLGVLFGSAGAIKIRGDVREASIFTFSQDAVTASVTIGGSLIGGKRGSSGTIAGGIMGPVKIAGDIVGGAGFFSGVVGGPGLDSLSLGGSLRGGSGTFSGTLLARTIGEVSIGGSQFGGAGSFSGNISTNVGSLGKVSIKGNQIGGAGSVSGLILTQNAGSNIASVTIGGDARGGTQQLSGGIIAGGTLGPVSIKGDVTGTAEAAYTIRGVGPLTGTTSLAIAGVKVGGDFDHALVLAGYGFSDTPTNGHAQIGAISVGGDWLASSVSAGLLSHPGATGTAGVFGNGDDAFITAGPAGVVASIASITIKGRATGTLATGDFFGIVAEQIGKATIGGVKLALTTGTDAAGFPIGSTPDFFLREVARV